LGKHRSKEENDLFNNFKQPMNTLKLYGKSNYMIITETLTRLQDEFK